jgi:hypothetical protein
MTGEHLLEGLRGVISARVPLSEIVPTLREYRHQGVSRHQIQSALNTLRERASDEETEDRILEIMDIVNGFCSPHLIVWEE